MTVSVGYHVSDVLTPPVSTPVDPDRESWQLEQQRYWDDISSDYDRLYTGAWSRLENEWVKRQLTWIRDLDAPTVVDLGCGTGLGWRMVNELNRSARYLGVDVSPQMTRAVPEPATTYIGAMDDLHFLSSGEADVILALFSSASYAYRTEEVFREVARILRPGGRAYLSFLSPGGFSRLRAGAPPGRYRTRGDNRPDADVPVRLLSLADVHRLGRAAGMSVVSAMGMNVFSGLVEQPWLWRLGRVVARFLPERSHTIEVVLEKESWRPERLHDAFPVFRVRCGDRLPKGWVQQVADCATRYGEMKFLDGGSVTSRQAELGQSTESQVGVVTGKVVAAELSWLDEFYRGEVLALANQVGVGELVPSTDCRSAVNINVLPPGSQYEWHVDSNPLTALLFATSHPTGTGGELVFRPDPKTRPGESWQLVIRPEAGDLLIFDARQAAHMVRRVDGAESRLSVPMNFYLADTGASRPYDLDEYLYGGLDASIPADARLTEGSPDDRSRGYGTRRQRRVP